MKDVITQSQLADIKPHIDRSRVNSSAAETSRFEEEVAACESDVMPVVNPSLRLAVHLVKSVEDSVVVPV